MDEGNIKREGNCPGSGRLGRRGVFLFDRVEAYRLDPPPVHLDHLEGKGPDGHPVTYPGESAEMPEDIASDGRVISVVQRGSVLGVELRDRHRAVQARAAILGTGAD